MSNPGVIFFKMGIQVEVLPVTLFQQNCSLVWEEETMKGIIIDGGGEAERILARVNELGIKLQYLLNTHCHIDHVGAIQQLKTATNLPFYCHKEEQFWIDRLEMQAQMFFFDEKPQKPKVEAYIEDRSILPLGDNHKIEVIFTPGHTPGGCCFYIESEGILIAGDTLFLGSIGRTDLPRGNHQELLDNIRTRLFILPDEVTVYPGHGPTTTIGYEKKSNPFVAMSGI